VGFSYHWGKVWIDARKSFLLTGYNVLHKPRTKQQSQCRQGFIRDTPWFRHQVL